MHKVTKFRTLYYCQCILSIIVVRRPCRLSKAAVSRYKKLKQQSTEGLKDIVQHHKYTEVGSLVITEYYMEYNAMFVLVNVSY